MLPVVHGENNKKIYIILCIIIITFFDVTIRFRVSSSLIYIITSVILGLEFLRRTHALIKVKNNSENKLFLFSITYLFLLFLSMFR